MRKVLLLALGAALIIVACKKEDDNSNNNNNNNTYTHYYSVRYYVNGSRIQDLSFTLNGKTYTHPNLPFTGTFDTTVEAKDTQTVMLHAMTDSLTTKVLDSYIQVDGKIKASATDMDKDDSGRYEIKLNYDIK